MGQRRETHFCLPSPQSVVMYGVLCVSILLVSCVSYPEPDKHQDQCMAHVSPDIYGADPSYIPRPSGTVVRKTIRFTDDGEFVNRCEMTDVLKELQVEQPQIILVYVHGWKHNANDEKDTDLESFGTVLHKLGAAEEESSSPRQVVGIYIGWNGKATWIPLLEELSFWSRKAAADRLTQAAAITKFLGALRRTRELVGQPRDLVVFIGHSFGARILFSASSDLLLYNSQMKHPGAPGLPYEVIKGPADLIVLLNPAFEALWYTAFNALRRYKETFSLQQPPLLVTIATDNDSATGLAFPVGQVLGLEMRSRQRTTLGNYAPYFTHELSFQTTKTSEPFNQEAEFWYDDFCNGGICLRRNSASELNQIPPGNPFVVAATNKQVLVGHNGIWEKDFLRWLNAFVKMVDKKKQEKEQPITEQ